MTSAFVNPWIYVSVALLLAALCPGCVNRHSYAKHQFVLEATRPAQSARQRHDVVLAVRGFTIDPVYDGRGLRYRKGESEYESDFYNEFLIAPQVLLGSQARNWLSRSGMFRTVLEPGSLIEPTHILEGNVLVLHGDFRGQNLPQAVIQIRIFLVASKRSQPEIVFTRDYRASHEAQAPTASALVAAFDRCLEQVLSALEEDLEKVL
jgi:cholesterol transport system auxiliary component